MQRTLQGVPHDVLGSECDTPECKVCDTDRGRARSGEDEKKAARVGQVGRLS